MPLGEAEEAFGGCVSHTKQHHIAWGVQAFYKSAAFLRRKFLQRVLVAEDVVPESVARENQVLKVVVNGLRRRVAV